MKSNLFSSLVNYFSLLSLGGAVFFSFLFVKIKINPPFLKLNYKKIMENHSDLSVFMCAIFFTFCFFLCNFYQNKLQKINENVVLAEKAKEICTRKEKKIQIPFNRRTLMLKDQYLSENYEMEEKKKLIDSLDDNENF